VIAGPEIGWDGEKITLTIRPTRETFALLNATSIDTYDQIPPRSTPNALLPIEFNLPNAKLSLKRLPEKAVIEIGARKLELTLSPGGKSLV